MSPPLPPAADKDPDEEEDVFAMLKRKRAQAKLTPATTSDLSQTAPKHDGGMIEIKEVFDFVGEEIVVTKCVSVDSKEAKAAAARPIVSNSSGLFFNGKYSSQLCNLSLLNDLIAHKPIMNVYMLSYFLSLHVDLQQV